MSWKVYVLPPIDFGWEQLKTVRETLSSIDNASGESDSCADGDIGSNSVMTFVQDWEDAKHAATDVGVGSWEGDFRDPPRVFWVPDEGSFTYAFVFKQENNGNTYVVSPVDLPYLTDIAV